mmetsp:Transcript_110076/g.351115  ORF Transcript_110076/g.351115 Transcript_110076/m.351115 type:complete len:681 (+) Transcript_110076:809-2851(+)
MVKSRPLTVRKFCMNWDWSMPNELRIGPTPVLPMSREFCKAWHTGEYTRVPRTNERRVGRTTRVSVRLIISSLASPCQAEENREAGGPPLYPSPPVPRLRGLRGAADAADDASLQEAAWESSGRSQRSPAATAEGSPQAAPCVLAGAPARCLGKALLLQVARPSTAGARAAPTRPPLALPPQPLPPLLPRPQLPPPPPLPMGASAGGGDLDGSASCAAHASALALARGAGGPPRRRPHWRPGWEGCGRCHPRCRPAPERPLRAAARSASKAVLSTVARSASTLPQQQPPPPPAGSSWSRGAKAAARGLGAEVLHRGDDERGGVPHALPRLGEPVEELHGMLQRDRLQRGQGVLVDAQLECHALGPLGQGLLAARVRVGGRPAKARGLLVYALDRPPDEVGGVADAVVHLLQDAGGRLQRDRVQGVHRVGVQAEAGCEGLHVLDKPRGRAERLRGAATVGQLLLELDPGVEDVGRGVPHLLPLPLELAEDLQGALQGQLMQQARRPLVQVGLPDEVLDLLLEAPAEVHGVPVGHPERTPRDGRAARAGLQPLPRGGRHEGRGVAHAGVEGVEDLQGLVRRDLQQGAERRLVKVPLLDRPLHLRLPRRGVRLRAGRRRQPGRQRRSRAWRRADHALRRGAGQALRQPGHRRHAQRQAGHARRRSERHPRQRLPEGAAAVEAA